MQIQGETSINKLILLFVFDKMESALSERTLVDMCATSNDWINYMDCVMMISQLLEDGFICTVETNDDTLYTITPDGRSCLANFYINIPKSVREEIAVFVKNNSAKYRNRQECKSDYYQNKDGTYTVFLRILAPVHVLALCRRVIEILCDLPEKSVQKIRGRDRFQQFADLRIRDDEFGAHHVVAFFQKHIDLLSF